MLLPPAHGKWQHFVIRVCAGTACSSPGAAAHGTPIPCLFIHPRAYAGLIALLHTPAGAHVPCAPAQSWEYLAESICLCRHGLVPASGAACHQDPWGWAALVRTGFTGEGGTVFLFLRVRSPVPWSPEMLCRLLNAMPFKMAAGEALKPARVGVYFHVARPLAHLVKKPTAVPVFIEHGATRRRPVSLPASCFLPCSHRPPDQDVGGSMLFCLHLPKIGPMGSAKRVLEGCSQMLNKKLVKSLAGLFHQAGLWQSLHSSQYLANPHLALNKAPLCRGILCMPFILTITISSAVFRG